MRFDFTTGHRTERGRWRRLKTNDLFWESRPTPNSGLQHCFRQLPYWLQFRNVAGLNKIRAVAVGGMGR
jgi:hypothetical protein